MPQYIDGWGTVGTLEELAQHCATGGTDRTDTAPSPVLRSHVVAPGTPSCPLECAYGTVFPVQRSDHHGSTVPCGAIRA